MSEDNNKKIKKVKYPKKSKIKYNEKIKEKK